MPARLASILFALALVPGCKSMGGLASGFGHVASGVGHVAGDLGRVAGGAARGLASAAPVVARGVGTVGRIALPIAEDVVEAVALSPGYYDDNEPHELAPTEDYAPPTAIDPCLQCSEDVPCETCAGYGDYACQLTPPGASTRCESTAPPGTPPSS